MEKPLDIDYILDNYVGGGSHWQWLTFVATFPTVWASLYPLFMHIFAAYKPNHRCFVPSCDGPDSILNASHTEFTIPKEHLYTNIFKENAKLDPCSRYRSKFEDEMHDCSPEYFLTNETVGCDAYVYDREIFTNTLTTDIDLVCKEGTSRRLLLSTYMMLGLLFGSPIGGKLGDAFGRKPIMIGAVLLLIPSIACASISPEYYLYATLRFMSAFCLPVVWVNHSAYCYEIFGPKYRKYVAALIDFPLPIFIFCAIIYFNRSWQNLHFAVAGACALGLPLLVFYLPESPRWLVLKNRQEEAVEIFLKIAKTNRRELTDTEVSKVKEIVNLVATNSGKEKHLTILDLFRGKLLNKTLIIMSCWITVCLGYYALTLNATELAGDPILNFVLATVADSPVCLFLLLTLDRIGRRFTLCLTHVTLGLSCIVLAFIPKAESTWILIVYLLGKGASGAGFQMVWMYTNELFPTNLRGQAVGTSSMVSRIFTLCIPFVGALAMFWKPLPMVVLGIPTVLSGLVAIILPETSGKDLPQTIEEADMNSLSFVSKYSRDSRTSMESMESN